MFDADSSKGGLMDHNIESSRYLGKEESRTTRCLGGKENRLPQKRGSPGRGIFPGSRPEKAPSGAEERESGAVLREELFVRNRQRSEARRKREDFAGKKSHKPCKGKYDISHKRKRERSLGEKKGSGRV